MSFIPAQQWQLIWIGFGYAAAMAFGVIKCKKNNGQFFKVYTFQAKPVPHLDYKNNILFIFNQSPFLSQGVKIQIPSVFKMCNINTECITPLGVY